MTIFRDIGLDEEGPLSSAPPRSPDLIAIDFYLWGTVEGQVYRRKPRTLEDLRQETTAACAAISIETLTDVAAAITRRCVVCLAANGEHFEHLKCAVSSTQKFLVQQHITTSKHQANKQLNSKQRQLFLTQPTTSNVRSEFNIDLCRSLISADIPLYKLKNKVFREFLEKYTQHTIPDESTLRKTYAASIYDETIQKIRDEIKDSSIWVSIDETPDKEDVKQYIVVTCPARALCDCTCRCRCLLRNVVHGGANSQDLLLHPGRASSIRDNQVPKISRNIGPAWEREFVSRLPLDLTVCLVLKALLLWFACHPKAPAESHGP
ncbi:hypothetical protein ANN_04675 [Periplaneta americana]|uniref:Uncharacterized protein n=1 Tax=Periplaneta americana TaxID=6978 RepID=A0ABQ8TBH1_PERAM|nr:hypothetical protein ANN_04675 [Periplaneta americana]